MDAFLAVALLLAHDRTTRVDLSHFPPAAICYDACRWNLAQQERCRALLRSWAVYRDWHLDHPAEWRRAQRVIEDLERHLQTLAYRYQIWDWASCAHGDPDGGGRRFPHELVVAHLYLYLGEEGLVQGRLPAPVLLVLYEER